MPLNSSPCTVGPAEFDAKRAALEQSSIADFAQPHRYVCPSALRALAVNK